MSTSTMLSSVSSVFLHAQKRTTQGVFIRIEPIHQTQGPFHETCLLLGVEDWNEWVWYGKPTLMRFVHTCVRVRPLYLFMAVLSHSLPNQVKRTHLGIKTLHSAVARQRGVNIEWIASIRFVTEERNQKSLSVSGHLFDTPEPGARRAPETPRGTLPRTPQFSGAPCRTLSGTLRARRARKTLLAGRGFPNTQVKLSF